jgi:hypothetical protein
MKHLKFLFPDKRKPSDKRKSDAPAEEPSQSLPPSYPGAFSHPVGCEVLFEGAAPIVE